MARLRRVRLLGKIAGAFALVAASSAGALSACGGEIAAETPTQQNPSATGGLNEPCNAGDTCNAGLACVAGTCVDTVVLPPLSDGGKSPPSPDASTSRRDAGVQSDVDASSLLDQLGGLQGLEALVMESIEAADGIAGDPQLLTYFAIRTGGGFSGTATGGAPSLSTVEDCFAHFLSNAAASPDELAQNPYPLTVGGATFFYCRPMSDAHAGLGVTDNAFSKFVAILAAKFAALGVTSAELTAISGPLLGTSGDIIDETRSAAVDGEGGGPASGDIYGVTTAYGASCATLAATNGTDVQTASAETDNACDPSH